MANIITTHVETMESYLVENAVTGYPSKFKFNDKETAAYCGRLKKIIIQSYGFVDGVEFIYEEDVSAGIHGNYTGSRQEFVLGENEYIIYVGWKTASGPYGHHSNLGVVTWITFKTNKGSVFTSLSDGIAGDWTNRKEYSCQADEGEEIIGLAGYAGSKSNWLYSLTKIYIKELTKQYTLNEECYNDYYFTYNCRRLAKIKVYCGWVIDKLHFVYTDASGQVNEALTESHGNGKGTLNEITLAETEYVSRVFFESANTNYYAEKVMYYLEFTIKDRVTLAERKCAYGSPPAIELNSWRHKHNFTVEANDGYELFAFSGVHCLYMGELETIYQRKLTAPLPKLQGTPRQVQSGNATGNLNQSNAHILFINCTLIYDPETKKPIADEVIKYVYKNWRSWRGKNMQKIKQLYSDDDIDILTDNQVTNAVVQRAILSGQYRYISIRTHGFQESIVGMEFSSLLSKTMIKKDADKYKNALKDTVINLFCCNCAYRNGGLAVTLVQNNAMACYGFTVPLAFYPDLDETLISFSSFIDNALVIDKKSINMTSKLLLKKFDDYLGDMFRLHSLDKNITDELAKQVDATEQSIRTWVATKTTRIEKHIHYWYMLRNKKFFCGPGTANASLAAKNYGELCKDFGNSVCYLEKGNWAENPSEL